MQDKMISNYYATQTDTPPAGGGYIRPRHTVDIFYRIIFSIEDFPGIGCFKTSWAELSWATLELYVRFSVLSD